MTVKHLPNVLVLPAIDNIKEIGEKLGGKAILHSGYLSDIEITMINGEISVYHKGENIKRYDFVWLTSFWPQYDISYALSLCLEELGVEHTEMEVSVSKLVDFVKFTRSKLPLPRTYFCCSKNITQQKLGLIENTCGYPLIVKDTKGSHGENLFLVKDCNELKTAIEKFPKNRDFMLQQFIPNEYDWGVLVAFGKVVSAEKSFPAKGEFRNNRRWGANEVFVKTTDVPDEIARIAIKANEILGLDWARSDIVVDKYTNKAYILETNRFPGTTKGTSEVDAAVEFLIKELKLK